MDKQLTEQQYADLVVAQQHFDTVIKANYVTGMSTDWTRNVAKPIYLEVFNEVMNTRCSICVMNAMRRLHNKMEEFRLAKTKEQVSQAPTPNKRTPAKPKE